MALLTHLVVGLGNPGNEYVDTRHNIGFMAVDALSDAYRSLGWKKKFKSLVSSGPHFNFLLMKPQTFMNLSGDAVQEAMHFHKLQPKDIIVFHDDIDLMPGQVKIKQGGGAAGHNGLRSLDAHIGPDYWRVRLGVGHPGVKGDAVLSYVLSAFSKMDRKWLDPLIENIPHDFDVMLQGRPKEYLKQFETKPKSP